LSYAYPRATDIGTRLKTMLSVYAKAGGVQPALLLHDQENGSKLVDRLGRLAQAGGELQGMPARVMPVDLHHSASTGIDVWLTAVAYGATAVAVLTTSSDAPQYVAALKRQIDVAQTILNGLGYEGVHLSVIEANEPMQLDVALAVIRPAQVPLQHALFNIAADKRSTLTLAVDHLKEHAPVPVAEIALPVGAPFGVVNVDKQACTLCMSCVGACPEAALADNPNMPQLRFIETNCVQCGLCEKTCPEDAITLAPRLLLTDAARQPTILNEAQPFHCIRCQKPFGTAQMIENMIAKLSLHGAFSGNVDRLKMCQDCRVVDMMANRHEAEITDLKRI
jgi:ferredoxin